MRWRLAGEQQQRHDTEKGDQRDKRDQNTGFHEEHGSQIRRWHS